MNKFVLACAIALSPLPSFAAEYAHCYVGEAPADAPLSPEQNITGLLFTVQVANVRHACGSATEADRAIITQRISEGGCSESSQVSVFALEVLDGPAEDARAMVMTDAGGKEGLFNRICAAAAKCVPGTNSYDENCESEIRNAM